jgi:2-amino-4-hydroxy-6-hydroxymethyldihydropteridine diphosphokinase
MEEVLLSLGSNMDDRAATLRKAVAMIGERAGEVTAVSGIYETEPWGFSADTPFYNIAVAVHTSLEPAAFLAEILAVEAVLGRVRDPGAEGYASRPIDIDILFFGVRVIDAPSLIVPHPRLHERRFVLVPLNEIASERVHPTSGKKVLTMVEECSDDSRAQRTICDL